MSLLLQQSGPSFVLQQDAVGAGIRAGQGLTVEAL